MLFSFINLLQSCHHPKIMSDSCNCKVQVSALAGTETVKNGDRAKPACIAQTFQKVRSWYEHLGCLSAGGHCHQCAGLESTRGKWGRGRGVSLPSNGAHFLNPLLFKHAEKCRFKLPEFPGERNGESFGYFCPAGDVGALWSAHVWFSSQDLCLPQCRGWPDRSAEIAQLRTDSVFCFSFYWLCGTISTISFSTA